MSRQCAATRGAMEAAAARKASPRSSSINASSTARPTMSPRASPRQRDEGSVGETAALRSPLSSAPLCAAVGRSIAEGAGAAAGGGYGSGKENDSSGANSPNGKAASRPAAFERLGRLEKVAAAAAAAQPSLGDRVRAEAARVEYATPARSEAADSASADAIADARDCMVRGASWRRNCVIAEAAVVDETEPLESVRRRFALLQGALEKSNASQQELQGLLERALDQSERQRCREAEYRQQNERLQDSEMEAKLQCSRLRASEEEAKRSEKEARQQCEQLRASVTEVKLQCSKLRASEAEAKRVEAEARQQCEKLRDSEADARHKFEQLRASEAEVKLQCNKLRGSEAEAKRLEADAKRLEKEAKQQCENLRQSEAEARHKCEQLRASEADVKLQCDRLRASEAEARNTCEELSASEAEFRRSRDHYQHKWCVVEQERDGLQHVAQQAQAAEKIARLAEKAALEEAAAWRRWLASLLDVLLRRGARGLDVDGNVSASQSLQSRDPLIHGLLVSIAEGTDRPEMQPDLLARLPSVLDHLRELIAGGKLAVRWGDQAADQAARKAEAAPAVDDSAERISVLERRLQQRELAVAALEHDRRALQGELRHLQNVVQELKGSIRVFCRLRPPRRGPGGPLVAAGIGCRAEGSQRVGLRKPPGDRRHEFMFDRVFPPDTPQASVYEEVEPLLPGLLDGLHLCIFAYGQTGAGKTYTISGATPDGRGCVPIEQQGIQGYAIADLLHLAEVRSRESDGAVSYEMWVSALEIYNESIQDLLADASSGVAASLDVRQSRDGGLGNAAYSSSSGGGAEADAAGLPSPFGSMRVPGLNSWRIHGPEDVEPALQLVAANRHVAATALNNRSSRSHCVLSLSLVRRGADGALLDDAGVDGGGAARGAGVLHIVDLAGSERTKVSQAEGQQMKEANAINKSLATLADVLFALGEDSPHVPYRNSKLTYLLQEALGGSGCKTLLFAQISPEPADVHETYSTLTFASRVGANVQKGRTRPSSAIAPTRDSSLRAPQRHTASTPPRTNSAPLLPRAGEPRGSPGAGREPRGSPARLRSARRPSGSPVVDRSPRVTRAPIEAALYASPRSQAAVCDDAFSVLLASPAAPMRERLKS